MWALLFCGYSFAGVSRLTGMNPTTVSRWHKSFMASELLEANIPSNETFARAKYLYKNWDYIPGERTEKRQAANTVWKLVIEPFQTALMDRYLRQPCLNPPTRAGKAWTKFVADDRKRIEAVIETIIQTSSQPVKGKFPTNEAVQAEVDAPFRDGMYVPAWSWRAEMLEKVLDRLTSREREVVKLIFGFDNDPLSLTEASKLLNVTPERVRQINIRAINKLRLIVRELGDGMVGNQIDWLRSQLERAKNEIEAINRQHAIEIARLKVALGAGSPEDAALIQEEASGLANDIRLEDLDFSQRAFNCLRRVGYTSLNAIAKATEDNLLSIRGFGKKNLIEVRQKLEEHGLELKTHAN